MWAVYDPEASGPSEPNKKLYALKDCWVNTDRIREGQILTLIKAALKERDPSLLKRFLTTHMHGDVAIDNELDDTLVLIRRGKRLKWKAPQVTESTHTMRTMATSGGAVPNLPSAPEEPPKLDAILDHARQHYRIVFTEIGRPLSQLQTCG